MTLIKVVLGTGDFTKIPYRPTCPNCDKRWDEVGVGEVKTVSCTSCGDGYVVSFEVEA